MKYIIINNVSPVFAFTRDLVEFNSIEFATIEDHGNVKVSVKIGYKKNNPAFEFDLKTLETIYGKDAVKVTDKKENLEDPF